MRHLCNRIDCSRLNIFWCSSTLCNNAKNMENSNYGPDSNYGTNGRWPTCPVIRGSTVLEERVPIFEERGRNGQTFSERRSQFCERNFWNHKRKKSAAYFLLQERMMSAKVSKERKKSANFNKSLKLGSDRIRTRDLSFTSSPTYVYSS